MEIVCIQGAYRIKHDGELWTQNELELHVSYNGHLEERVSFVAPNMRMYREMGKIAENIESKFNVRTVRNLN